MKISILLLLFFVSCSTAPLPVIEGKDQCQSCMMTVVDSRFSAEIMTKKNKALKFDDAVCLFNFIKSGEVKENEINKIFFINYLDKKNFINAEQAVYLISSDFHSPMNGNVTAFANQEEARKIEVQKTGEILDWKELCIKMQHP